MATAPEVTANPRPCAGFKLLLNNQTSSIPSFALRLFDCDSLDDDEQTKTIVQLLDVDCH